ncbi:MAG: FAD-dependent oxidoreductase [Chitinophagaceae bacterium]|nr:FAD-dependent oxidoreductase [Chitinophagaceae bacterium]
MQTTISIRLLPSEAGDTTAILGYIARLTGYKKSAVSGFHILKSSIDARGRQAYINLTLLAFINEPFHQRTPQRIAFKDVTHAATTIIIVGAGPAGLFAALRLCESGIKPLILERGKDVKARRRDLAALNKKGIVHPDSNYCFGEGGAGTYSDGKLYTRSNKRGDINRILNLFVQFGADEKILYEAHPHIGTNKLPQIITAMREQILQCGGIFLFEKKVSGFIVDDNQMKGVTTADGHTFTGNAVILATGHSARDIFQLLVNRKIQVEAKPFALGVRIEHPQALIDTIQYHTQQRGAYLPPASYSLVQQVDDRGVFSFCMCPGGIIAPAATSAGEIVVNGWSPSKRNNPFANSGMVVAVSDKDLQGLEEYPDKKQLTGPLSMMHFQQWVEQRSHTAGGGGQVAPAQRLCDFTADRVSASLPACSYIPGLNSVALKDVLPGFVAESLKQALREFGKKMKGYDTNEAVLVATESRTSSPVRIPRDPETLQHPDVKNLYPCGEGAGYAGGIISAAMDGEKIADLLAVKYS